MDFRNLITFCKSDVFGLDIGSSSVKAVGLRKDESGYVVTAAGIAEISLSATSTGLIHKTGTTRAIRECLAQMPTRSHLAVCSVSGPDVIVRDFEFQAIPVEEIAGAVELEASQVCPFNMSEGVVDHHLMTQNDDRLSGTLVAATNALVQERVKAATEASVECAMVDVDGLALLNCFTELERLPAGQTVAILNIGRMHTTIAILGPSGQPFVRDMTCAGNQIISRIASDKEMAFSDVAHALSGDAGEECAKLRDSLRHACQDLAEEVNTTYRFYKTQNKDISLGKMHICGGFALVEDVVELLQEQLAVDVELWNPFDSIPRDARYKRKSEDTTDILKTRGPAMAVAAGLALRST